MHGAVWGGVGTHTHDPPVPPPRRGAGPGRGGARRDEMLQLFFFFFFSVEEGGRWIELCHVADKFPLASSPCISPPPPLRTHACFFLFFFFPLPFFFFLSPYFPRFTSRLQYLRHPGRVKEEEEGERFSCLSTFPCPLRAAAHPAELRPPPCPAALPPPRRRVRPGADALVLPAQEAASCPGATELISGGKAEVGGTGMGPTIRF